MQPFTFNTCKSIVNKPGSLSETGDLCHQLGMKRPLVVTDAGIVSLGMLDQLSDYLTTSELPVATFTEVVADPPEPVVTAAIDRAREIKADGVIGFGGGSSMDTAKLVALVARSGEPLADIFGVNQAKGPRLPLILVPTTAGTGSEVTAVAIVTTGATTKMGVVSPHLYPDVALLDAELTLGLPSGITAMTGIDAMVHAIEAYTSKHQKNLYSDMLAREALKLMSANIRRATLDGHSLPARQGMLLGACLAGQAFANAPVAAVHALAYPLGGHYHIPHGLSNSLVLPEVLRFNASTARDLYAELAEILVPVERLDKTVEGRCDQFIHYFTNLIDDLGLPAKLSESGVPEADLPMLAEEAMLQQRLLINNPRDVTRADALAIYKAAF